MALSIGATYRLQLHREFGFDAAAAAAGYLARLGVTHAYTSPILAARPGSTHGYDQVNPAIVSPELGGDDARARFRAALDRVGLGHLVDIVPNHAGIGPANPYWEDVLARGRGSPFAGWFDVDWEGNGNGGRVLLPLLGRELDEALEQAELSLVIEGAAPRLRYFEQSFPLSPETARELAADGLEWSQVPAARHRLAAVIERQHYRLCHWKRADREINYRRFFDVNDLIALRMEDPAVFQAVHERVLGLVECGEIDGLRVDHVDGLRDPQGYLDRLRDEVDRRTRKPGSRIPVYVEKILAPGERLPETWPVEGTTGYEFLADLEGIFLDPEGVARIRQAYREFCAVPGCAAGFDAVARGGKVKILRGPLRADVARLSRLLRPLTRQWPVERRVTGSRLIRALQDLIACFPVYRTYLVPGRPASDQDRGILQAAVDCAVSRRGADPVVMDGLQRLLLGEWENLAARHLRRAREFVARFQQLTGPAAAKGIEDTALYQYVPLVSLNEVGGDPDRPLADAVTRMHDGNRHRAQRWPGTLLCTATHDTKRSGDVRSRLDVLSEIPDQWLAAVRRWRRLNRPLRGRSGRRSVPDRNTEYFFYQAVLGIWPASGDVSGLGDRLEAYLLKAVREARLRSTWTEGDRMFEDQLVRFIRAAIDPERSAAWLRDLGVLAGQVSRPGYWNALSRLLVHLTAPGAPDLYQGDELWNFSLVDPDNRRPVDFQLRGRLMDELAPCLEDRPPLDRLAALLERPDDGKIKLYLTARALKARQAYRQVFAGTTYQPLEAAGALGHHVVGFAREGPGGPVVTIVPRLARSLTGSIAPPIGRAVWQETRVTLPAAASWTCLLSGHVIGVEAGSALVGDVFSHLPVALLVPGPVS